MARVTCELSGRQEWQPSAREGGNQMSRCDEYREKLLEVEEKIRKLEGWPSVRESDLSRHREIDLLERQRQVLKDKYDRSLKRGGC
jgi:hypothetical protein